MTAVAVYLVAITAANVSVALLGPSVVVLNAFLLIGLDLTLRDRLHERWAGRWLVPKMGALILAGGLLSYLATPAAGPIAVASAVAWAAASSADALVYALLERRPRWQRVNGSNVVGAAVDSLLFPTLAFGALLPLIVVGQFLAKVAGGAVWYAILRALSRHRHYRAAPELIREADTDEEQWAKVWATQALEDEA